MPEFEITNISELKKYIPGNATTFGEAYRYPDKLFKIFGIVIETHEKRNPWATAYKWLGLLSPLLFLIFALNFDGNCHHVQCYMEICFSTAPGLNNSVKVITILCNANHVIRLRNIVIERLSKHMQRCPSSEYQIAHKYLKTINKTKKWITASFISCGFVFNLLPIISFALDAQEEDWLLPLKVKLLFIDSKSHPGYEINYLFCFFHINDLCFITTATDLIFFLLCIYVCIELDICKINCQKIGTIFAGETGEEQRAHLRQCLLMYENTCRYIKDLLRFFSWVIFGQSVISVVTLTATIVVGAVESLALTVTMLIELFSFCFIGQLILNKSDRVSESIYSSEWYKLLRNRKTAKVFQMFQQHAQRRNELSAFRIFKFSYIMLWQILKATCSYVAFLRNFT